jgi:ABC-2 type transport system permease protein
MGTILATLAKELTALRRDRAGLLVLLVMPVSLVLILSLVQDSVMRAAGEAPIRVLFVDEEGGFLGREIAKRLREGGGLELVTGEDGRPYGGETAGAAVARGDYPFCIVVPRGSGEAFRNRVRAQAEGSLSIRGKRPPTPAPPPAPEIAVRFDPAVQGAFRTAVAGSVRQALLGIEMKARADAFAEVLPGKMKRLVGESIPAWPGMPGSVAVPDVAFESDDRPSIGLREQAARGGPPPKRPSAAQHNVPAWTLFGMFFIVVPLSGSLIRERESGTLRRVLTTPASPASLLAGKVAAYVLVCLGQFALMLAVGVFVLPRLGTSGLVPGPEFLAAVPVALAAALAAAGYGIMVGTLSRSYEQASMAGAVSVVLAAAVGGIMVPVYAMPRFMQRASVVSPLAWGLEAFQELFVRGGGFRAAVPGILRLAAFFAATALISRFAFRGKDDV